MKRPVYLFVAGACALSGALLSHPGLAEQQEAQDISADPELQEPLIEETPESLPAGLPRRDRGAEVAVRGSYGVPFGASREDTGIGDLIAGIIPVQVDLGYRVDEHWFVGGFGAAGIGVMGAECRDGGQAATAPSGGTEQTPTFSTKCDAPNNFRLGVEVLYHLSPMTDDVAPWVGLGVGYEWLNISETLGRQTFVQTFSGIEFLNLQAGVDFAIGSSLRVGPFGHWTLGRFSRLSADASADAQPLPVPDNALHHWLNLGIKASVGPFGG